MQPRTLFDKLWDIHLVDDLDENRGLIHIDRHFLNDLSSPQAFSALHPSGCQVSNPELTFGMVDHMVSTGPLCGAEPVLGAQEMVAALRRNTSEYGIPFFDRGDDRQGIVHVVGPELGLSLPGMTIVCGDSHTCTHGALGSWAFGIGTSDVEHVLVTQTLAVYRPRVFGLTLTGDLPVGTVAKDLALFIIHTLGVNACAGMALEFMGPLIGNLPMEARFTLCNMGIELGARAAMIAPDKITYAYVDGRVYAPHDMQAARSSWSALRSDPGACYDKVMTLDVTDLAPYITWGTNPSQAVNIDQCVPDPATEQDENKRHAAQRALDYMGLQAGQPMRGIPVNTVFIGSCTNGRLSDLQAAADVARHGHVASSVRALVVPGSTSVRREAERLGLDRVFSDAGFEWRESGCSMCVGMNGDYVAPGQRCVSTSNRNFEGRQGVRARTHLASPAMAAAAALAGCITDVREVVAYDKV